jgi:hypothetical protein
VALMRALLIALAMAACAAPAPRAREAGEVMAPLIGCWRGAFDGNPDIVDERCFSVLDGRHVVDQHAVRPTDYSGETTYHLDESSGRIVFAYAASDGGRSNGELAPIDHGFAFPAHTFRAADGAELRLRSTWRLDGADSFVVESEREENGAWRPFMRIRYRRAPE